MTSVMKWLEKHLWWFGAAAVSRLRISHFVTLEICQRVCFHRYWNVYLDENKEMRVALHLSACKLQTVLLFPAVMLVAGEALWELQTGGIKLQLCIGKVVETRVYSTIMEFEQETVQTFVFEFIYMRRLKKPQHFDLVRSLSWWRGLECLMCIMESNY